MPAAARRSVVVVGIDSPSLDPSDMLSDDGQAICVFHSKSPNHPANPERLHSRSLPETTMNSELFLVPRPASGQRESATRLKIGDLIIGRTPLCDVYVPDPTVSRRHAMLSVAAQGVIVTDLKSRNGTWINTERVGCVPVLPGDAICFGSVVFVISSDPNGESGLESDLATRDPHPQRGQIDLRTTLSPRQTDVLNWLIKGLLEKEVALKLGISRETVHNHVRAIYAVYDVHSRVELLLKVIPPPGMNSQASRKVR